MRTTSSLGVCLVAAVTVAAETRPAAYTAERAGKTVRLTDAGHAGRRVDRAVSGQRRVRHAGEGTRMSCTFPVASIEDPRAGHFGIPFLGPWANRLDEPAFYANGRRYAFDMELGNVRGSIPIHGFLGASEWQVVEVRADADAAWVTSRLEFFRSPLWMKQFPFAHTIEITHRLQDGVLEVRHAHPEPEPRADAGEHRLPPVLPAHGLAARRLDDRGRGTHPVAAGREQDPHRRDAADRAPVSRPAGGGA